MVPWRIGRRLTGDDAMTTAELARLLRRLREEEDARISQRYRRSLSFADGLFDRWDRAKRLGFGKGASIYDSALIYGEVQVGEGTWIGPYTVLDGEGGGLVIGSFCSIAAGVHIYTHDTIFWALSGGRLGKRTGRVEIGDCCYIGSQAVIAAGVKVGKQCVIAANSFVNRNVSDRAIVGGSPAVQIGYVEGEGENVKIILTGRQAKGLSVDISGKR